jgi:hydroxypyruvate reductase
MTPAMVSTATPRALLAALHGAAVQGAAPFARTREAVYDWWRAQAFPAGTPVHLFALGKASPAMAAGALAALQDHGVPVAGGIVVSAHVPGPADWHGVTVPPTVTWRQGDHPVPGPASLDAADALDDAIHTMEPDAVALVLLSGGTTALCAAPIAPLSQAVGDTAQAQAVLANLAQTLLESGLAIHEMNAIRRRVLRFGAGRLAVALANRGARRIGTFAISDVIGDDPAVIGSGPCTADPLDDADFLALLDAHDLRPRLQRAMSTVLGLAGTSAPPAVPSTTHPAWSLVDYTLVARNADAVAALAGAAEQSGIGTVLVDPSPLEGDADALGDALVRRALVLAESLPAGATALLIAGGEPVVNLRDTVERAVQRGDEDDARLAEYGDAAPRLVTDASSADEPMRGGRMQVLALSAALTLEQLAAHGHQAAWRITVLAGGTDGRDGPTDAAGAIVDAAVPALARRQGRSPEADLASGRSWFPLDAADALLRTGPTGTNVMDVVAMLARG